jgi:hypothetical protein
MTEPDEKVNVRYMVDDVEASTVFSSAVNSLDTILPPYLACIAHNTTTRTDWR